MKHGPLLLGAVSKCWKRVAFNSGARLAFTLAEATTFREKSRLVEESEHTLAPGKHRNRDKKMKGALSRPKLHLPALLIHAALFILPAVQTLNRGSNHSCLIVLSNVILMYRSVVTGRRRFNRTEH